MELLIFVSWWQLEESSKDQEHALLLAQKELKQSKALGKKYLRESKTEHDRSLSEAQGKYSRTCSEHDGRITDLSKSHANQCEELCREILRANLEADRLQSKLGAIDGSKKERTSVPFSLKPKKSSFGASSLYPALSVIVLVRIHRDVVLDSHSRNWLTYIICYFRGWRLRGTSSTFSQRMGSVHR
jgi:hypothetical protein